MEDGKVIEMILDDFKSIGYDVDYKVLNAANYGIPQMRERVIIIGNRIGGKNPYPTMTHYIDKVDDALIPPITVKDAIGFLSDVPLNEKPITMADGMVIYNHVANTNIKDTFFGRKYDVNQKDVCDYLNTWKEKKGLSIKMIDNYFGYNYTAGHWFRKDGKNGSIPSVKDWWKLKELLNFDDRYDKMVTTMEEKEITFEQSLRIEKWDRPSDTITATSPEIHTNKTRRLSVRECAILQTFPMDFIFTGSLSKMYRQVGNAVPVLLAMLIANGIKEELDKNNL